MADYKNALEQILKDLENDIEAERESVKAVQKEGLSGENHSYAINLLQGYVLRIQDLMK
jgi:hypothetical protein